MYLCLLQFPIYLYSSTLLVTAINFYFLETLERALVSEKRLFFFGIQNLVKLSTHRAITGMAHGQNLMQLHYSSINVLRNYDGTFMNFEVGTENIVSATHQNASTAMYRNSICRFIALWRVKRTKRLRRRMVTS